MRRSLFILLAAVALVACGSSSSSTAATTTARPTTATPDTLNGTVTVFAAASLTESFTALGKAFEALHPHVTVTFNFAGSSALAQQINDGNPADIFVSADTTNMKKVTDAGNAATTQVIAHNQLAILVAKGNPKKIAGLADLAKPGVIFVLCAPEVPCGKYGAAALAQAGVTAAPASLEQDVKAVVSKVTLGEADAGIVYVTDAKAAAGQADSVAIDIASDPALIATYPITVLAKTANPTAAQAFVEFVLSDAGQKTLAGFGFLPK